MHMESVKKLIFLAVFIFCGYNFVVARYTLQGTSREEAIIEAPQLKKLLEEGSVKLIDATYTLKQNFSDWKTFRKDYYGNFEKIAKKYPEKEYEQEHIHGAVPFSLDVGLYRGEFKRHDLYPPDEFEKYARKLGINNGDHVVVYGRGPFAGMIFAAHVWWILKYYGVQNAQVLNGGIDAWKKEGYPVDDEKVLVKNGNFKANIASQYAISFEELEAIENDNAETIDTLDTHNVFDGRPREEYSGEKPHEYLSSGPVNGFHIKGAKSLPALDTVDEHGLKSSQELYLLLDRAGFIPGRPTITYCSVGNQGSLLFLALTSLGIPDVKLYQGGMTEMSLRDPSKIL